MCTKVYQCSVLNVPNATIALHSLIKTAIKEPLIRGFYFVEQAGGSLFVTLSKALHAVLLGP